MNKLTIDEQIFIFTHEICHIAFNHINRSSGKNEDIWNIATDGVINAFLKKDGLHLVKGVVDISEAINYSAEELYNKLLNNKNKVNNNINNHNIWNNKELKKELRRRNNTSNNERRNDRIKRQQEKISQKKIKEIFEENKNKQKELLQDLRDELNNYSPNDTNSNVRKINNIGDKSNLIDWRYLLRESINYDLDYSYKNATIEDGVLTSHLEEFPKCETEIVLDTSGSVNEELLKCFLKECKNILQTSLVKVGCFDTKFYGFNIIRNFNDIDNMKFIGGGGTNFDVAINAFSKRVINRIIFTDGYADAPKNKLRVIWIIFGDREIDLGNSKVIHINEKDLIKKYHKFKWYFLF